MRGCARREGPLKERYARRADSYLVYTEGGARSLVSLGLGGDRIHVVRNTIDIEARFLGGVYDEREVGRWLRVAAAVTIPGKVGLAVNHALAHGVPVLTRESDLHAPEVEYLEDSVNGLIVRGGLDDYVRALAEVARSADLRDRLAAGALASRESLGLDHMVRAAPCAAKAHLCHISLLARRDAVLAEGPPDPATFGRFAGSEWTARLFRRQPGMLVPRSTVRAPALRAGHPLHALRMSRTGVWAKGETLRELYRCAARHR